MKQIYLLSLLTLGFLNGSQAASKTYNITSNTSWSSSLPSQCNDCIINVSAGVTLTLDNSSQCKNCTFSGGTLKITAGFSFNASSISNATINAATSFNMYGATGLDNVILNMTGGSVAPGSLTVNNSTLNFSGSSGLTINGASTITNSNFVFSGSAGFTKNGASTISGSNFTFSGSGGMTSNGGIDASNSNFTFSGTGSMTSNGGMDADHSNFIFSGSGSMTSNGTLNATDAAFTFSGSGSMTSGAINAGNSTFTFDNSNFLTANGKLDMDASFFYLNDNSHLLASSAELDNGSKIVVGDGSKTSNAYLYLNGQLSLDDASSYVILSNTNNYFHSWSGYKGGNHSYSTVVNGSPDFYGSAMFSTLGTLPITVLPITFGDFKGTEISRQAIRLSWTLTGASGQESMQIERSNDATHFSPVSAVSVNGSDAAYTYTDESPEAGENDYRIKLTGADGTITYSKIISVAINADANGGWQVFPNPCTGANFQIRFPAVQPAMIRVFSIDGKLLYMNSVNGQSQYAVHVNGAENTRMLVVQIITKEKTSSFNLLNAR